MSSIAVSVIYYVDRHEIISGANGQATFFINPLASITNGQGAVDRWLKYPYAALSKGTNNSYVTSNAVLYQAPFSNIADRIQ